MLDKGKLLFMMLVISLILVGCGNSQTLQKKEEYQDFKEQISNENYTGFAYILSDFKAKEEDYLSVIEDVFNKEKAELTYFDMQEAGDKVYDVYNEDTTNPDLYLPSDDIAFIKNGKMISELEVTDHIFSNEGNEELTKFINKHKK